MNAVEIEEAVSNLASQPFDAEAFPFDFLADFGNKDTTRKRLRKGELNASDLPGGIFHRNNIHMAVCDDRLVGPTPESAHQKFLNMTLQAGLLEIT